MHEKKTLRLKKTMATSVEDDDEDFEDDEIFGKSVEDGVEPHDDDDEGCGGDFVTCSDPDKEGDKYTCCPENSTCCLKQDGEMGCCLAFGTDVRLTGFVEFPVQSSFRGIFFQSERKITKKCILIMPYFLSRPYAVLMASAVPTVGNARAIRTNHAP